MTRPDREPAAAQASRAAAARAGQQCHPSTVGRHETPHGGGHRHLDDLLPRVGSHRRGCRPGAGGRTDRTDSPGRTALDSGLALDSGVLRRPDCDFRGRQPRDRLRLGRGRARWAVQLLTHHCAVDRPAGPRCHGASSVAIQHGVIYPSNPDYYRPVLPELCAPTSPASSAHTSDGCWSRSAPMRRTRSSPRARHGCAPRPTSRRGIPWRAPPCGRGSASASPSGCS